jgi:hypothetical protein
MGAAPLPQPPVLHPARVPPGDAGRVTHHQGSHLVGNREGDDLAGGLVVGLVDVAAVTGLRPPLGPPIATPAARPALAGLGSPPSCSGLASLLVLEVQVALGPHRPPRHQQPGVLGHDRVRVDDAKIHPSDLIRVKVVLLNWHRRGD